jgi:hypothetical protein
MSNKMSSAQSQSLCRLSSCALHGAVHDQMGYVTRVAPVELSVDGGLSAI